MNRAEEIEKWAKENCYKDRGLNEEQFIKVSEFLAKLQTLKMKELREMIIVAIGCMEQSWAEAQQEKEKSATKKSA